MYQSADQQLSARRKGISAAYIVAGCAIIAYAFFYGVCGSDANFDDKGHPIDGNILGTLYQGGYVIPIVMTLLLTVFSLSFERMLALNKASGRGKISQYIIQVKRLLSEGDILGAEELSDRQQSSVANIVKSGLLRYRDIESANISNDEKATIMQKEIEEATALELPYLEQNLHVIATIASLGTLFGLLGTVLGMIRSFAALANEGAPDSIALSLGISEALMNTAMGIGTGAVAIISYGYFSSRVHTMTNAVDEVGFAIGQTFTKFPRTRADRTA